MWSKKGENDGGSDQLSHKKKIPKIEQFKNKSPYCPKTIISF